MQYDPRFEVPDSSKRLPVLLLKKLQQLLQNLTVNHWENKTSRKSVQHRTYRSLDLIFHLLCVFMGTNKRIYLLIASKQYAMF